MNNPTSFDAFLRLADNAHPMDGLMLGEIGVEPQVYEKIGLLKTCPTPFQIECTLCYTLSRLVVRHDKAMAFCPNCGCWFEPYEEQLKWWTPCFEPVLRSLYKGFACKEQTEVLIPDYLWRLGRSAIAGQSRVIYVVQGINDMRMNGRIIEKLPENKVSLLLVLGTLPEKEKCGSFDPDKIFSAGSLVSLEGDEIHVDTTPVKKTLEVLNSLREAKKRGPGKNAKIGDLQIKLKNRLLSLIHGVYTEIEHHERLGTVYKFHEITQKELAEQFNVDPSMVSRAIKKDAELKLLFDIAQNRDEAYNKGKRMEKNGY